MSLFGGWKTITGTRRRYSAGSYSAGVFVTGSSTDSAMTLSKHPPRGEALQILDEGQRSSEAWTVYTSTALRTAIQGATPTQGDEVVIGSTVYQVAHTWDRDDGDPLDHYKALMIKRQEGET